MLAIQHKEVPHYPCGDFRNLSARQNYEPWAIELPPGLIVGHRSRRSGLLEFLGVPYAAAPIGARRFLPPVPLARYHQPVVATQFGRPSLQVFDEFAASAAAGVHAARGRGQQLVLGSEDSLSLNIWTPACDGARRAVLVYIHGGANWLESSRSPLYYGAKLAQRGDAVVVTLNYRLGILGALDLSVLGRQAPAAAHASCVRDQLCALAWVRDNIAHLGGDPSNITLIGESAGSMDISWMLAADALRGKVRRVVMMSGVASVVGFGHDHIRSVHSLEIGRARARHLLNQMGISSLGDLDACDSRRLVRACAKVARHADTLFYMDTLFYPRVDPAFCKHDPFKAPSAGALNGIDVMIGFTGYEMGLWLNWNDSLDRHSAAWAAQNSPFIPDHLRAGLAKLYQTSFAHEESGVQGMHLLSDAFFGAPSVIFADQAARAGANVWCYRFDRQSTDPRRRAPHAADVCFFLGNWESPDACALIGECSSSAERNTREALSDTLQDTLINFARSGTPSAQRLPCWKRYRPGQRYYMRIDDKSVLSQDPLEGREEFWLNEVAKPVL